MKKNIGRQDRSIRIPMGILVLMTGFYLQTWWGLIGLFFLTTGFIEFSPVYKLLGISTRGKTAAEKVVM